MMSKDVEIIQVPPQVSTEVVEVGPSSTPDIVEVSQGLIPGPQGEVGHAGPPGESAYDVAVDDGFVGTEEEWLASLVGPRGDQGPQGEKGDAGDAGPAGEQGLKGDKGDKGDTGAEGAQGPKGDAGPVGVGVSAGGAVSFVLSKATATDYDTVWKDVNELLDWDRIASMINDAIADASETPPDELLTLHWDINDVDSTFAPSGTAAHSASDTFQRYGTGTFGSNNGHLVLNEKAFIGNTNYLPISLPTTADATTTQAPSIFRASFKGTLPSAATTGVPLLVDLEDTGASGGQFTLGTTSTAMTLTYGRNGDTETIISDTADLGLDADHLYEVEWTSDASGEGGTAVFYIDGAQVGASKATQGKPRLTIQIDMECNATSGATTNAVNDLEVEYIEIGWQA